MKPFNLQEALMGKAVTLRNGSKAYVRHHETELKVVNDWQLQGIKEDGDLIAWALDGSNSNEKMWYGGDEIIGMYPETRMINGFEVSAPETVAPELGRRYYTVYPQGSKFFVETVWDGDEFDIHTLERDLLFLCKDDAISTTKAMLGIDPNTGD